MQRFLLLFLAGAFALTLTSCDLSFDNPNAAGESEVVSTPEGLRALAIGMRRTYAVSTVSSVVRSSGLAAREFGVVVGFTNPQEIEFGGTALPTENGILEGLWLNNYRVMGMAEQIIDGAEIFADANARNSFLALGHLFKALTLGNLSMFYEQFPTTVVPGGDGTFTSRTAALEEAVQLLEDGLAALSGTTLPADFQQTVLGTENFDMNAVMNAYLARYQLFLGNYDAAIGAANDALTASTISVFVYDAGGGNENPLYLETTQEPATLRPLDNFGFDPADFAVPDADGRKAFYLEPLDEIGIASRLPVETMRGFFDTVDEAIPVYLPGEMQLIIAEAEARQGDLGAAIVALNEVRTKTDDPFGVNAGLEPYSGPETQEAVLMDIYRNRRVELFLAGTSLEDSRRFNRPAPPPEGSYETFTRTRNFFPYPQTERDNNPNTPADPGL